MSTITLNHSDDTLTSFVKGSPEMIHSLSVKESIPDDFFDVLEKYTQDGLRVLALGYKDLTNATPEWIKGCKREDIECDLTFIAFLIMENKVKPETKSSLDKLKYANISTIMATGDNGLTAIAVGRNCGIINPAKPVYLAEWVKTHEGEGKIRWIKIDSQSSMEEYLNQSKRNRNSVKLRKLNSLLF